MADLTKTTGQLLDWTLFDIAAALETSALDVSVELETTLHIDICEADGDAAPAGTIQVSVLIKSGTTDEDWHEFLNLSAAAATTASTALGATLTTGATQMVATGGDSLFVGKRKLFIHDGTLVNSEIVNVRFLAATGIDIIDNVVNEHAQTVPIRNVLNQFNIVLPVTASSVKLVFRCSDADSSNTARVRWTKVTEIA